MPSLLDLPLEMVRAILEEMVRVRGIKRAFRLRLVNKLFANEVLQAVSRTKLLDDPKDLARTSPRVFNLYVEQRILQERTNSLPVVNMARRIAERLAAEDGDPAQFSYYVAQVVRLLEPSFYPFAYNVLFTLDNPQAIAQDTDLFEHNLLVAAAFTGKLGIVKTYASLLEHHRHHLSHHHLSHHRGGIIIDGPILGTPLHAAIRGDSVEVVSFIFSECTEPEIFHKRSILHFAYEQGKTKVMKTILESSWSLLKDRHASGNIPWKHRTHNVELFDLLVAEIKARKPQDWEQGSRVDMYVVRYAVQEGRVELAQHLLARDPGLLTPDAVTGKYLELASLAGSNSLLELLMDHNVPFSGGELRSATINGHTNTVRLLLERTHGDWVRSELDKYAINIAAGKGYLAIVRMLLDYGAEFDQNLDSCYYPDVPMAQAVKLEHTKMVKLFIERGVDIRGNGKEWMKMAEGMGLESMVELLRGYIEGSAIADVGN